ACGGLRLLGLSLRLWEMALAQLHFSGRQIDFRRKGFESSARRVRDCSRLREQCARIVVASQPPQSAGAIEQAVANLLLIVCQLRRRIAPFEIAQRFWIPLLSYEYVADSFLSQINLWLVGRLLCGLKHLLQGSQRGVIVPLQAVCARQQNQS